MLDKKLNNKLVDDKILYTVVYEKEDYYTALEISNYIKTKYKNFFDEYKYEIKLITFSDFSLDTNVTAVYTLNSDKNIEKVADISKKKGIISFAYDMNNLKKGLLFSLAIEKSTVLYLNKENLCKKNIDFVDSLLQMVNFID